MSLEDYLAALPGRCVHGFAAVQHPSQCACTAKSESAELAIFVSALHVAASQSTDGLIHQTHVRPLIQRIPHKHRGTAYRKAIAAGLIEVAGKEPSTDAHGRNTDKDQKVYRLKGSGMSVYWRCLECDAHGQTTGTESGADVKHVKATGHGVTNHLAEWTALNVRARRAYHLQPNAVTRAIYRGGA